ncbi:hypothetical protein VTK56DRAFT_6082 [Thermocarpiscus australiensis]
MLLSKPTDVAEGALIVQRLPLLSRLTLVGQDKTNVKLRPLRGTSHSPLKPQRPITISSYTEGPAVFSSRTTLDSSGRYFMGPLCNTGSLSGCRICGIGWSWDPTILDSSLIMTNPLVTEAEEQPGFPCRQPDEHGHVYHCVTRISCRF